MKRTRLFVLLFIIGVALVGCDDRVRQRMRAETKGVKISDIMPLDKHELPPAIQFRVYTFILSEKMLSSSDNIFEILSKNEMSFVSGEAFKANGFAGGYARGNLWGELGSRLKQADAVGVKETSMVVYDDEGDDLIFGTLGNPVSIDYFTSAEDSYKVIVSPGQLVWRIVAIPIEDKPQTADVHIAAVSKPFAPEINDPFTQRRKPKAVVYDVSGFDVAMIPGDFLVLGPEKYDPEISLDTLSLTATGEFEVLGGDPNDIANSNGKMTLGRLLFKIEDKPLVRFFVVVCLGTGN